MAERLGYVLYVIGCLLGLAIFGVGIVVWKEAGGTEPTIIGGFLAAAVVVWGIGYGLRYILAGK